MQGNMGIPAQMNGMQMMQPPVHQMMQQPGQGMPQTGFTYANQVPMNMNANMN
jgi:hypothetical protein